LTKTKIKTFQHSEPVSALLKINESVLATGGLTIKLWDIGGQPRFRTMWERYCRGVNAIM